MKPQLALAVAILGLQASAGIAQEVDLPRFQSELSAMLLGHDEPARDGAGVTYIGIAVVPPGEAWTASPDEAQAYLRTLWGTSHLALQFNYPLEVHNGIANVRRQQRLETLWHRVLTASIPEQPPGRVDSLALFRPPDRVDVARDVDQFRLPSAQYTRYQEYRAAWRILDSARGGDDTWRFHPRFRSFNSIEEARAQIAEEWLRFGFKVEIEAAIQQFENEMLPGNWRTWSAAKTAFELHTVDVVPGIPTGRTIFFPADSDWQDMRSWSNVSFSASDGSTLRCQLARVKIQRPWLDLALLNDPEFRLGPASGLGVLSDGSVPTNASFAKGRMANLIDEIVLVRRVEGASPGSGHPLGRFVYPDAINLVAYVVRSLPALSGEEN